MGITVDDLLEKPFLNRSREEKERIIFEGKPRPVLKNLHAVDNLPPCTTQDDTDNRVNKYVIFFDVSSYDHVEWMTGCDLRQALFCWSCLLFRVQKDVWNTTGVTDLSQLHENIKDHEKSVSHIQGMLDLHLFSQQSSINKPSESKIDPVSDLVKRNREMVRRVIDVICFLVTQQQPPRAGTTDKNKLQIEDCLENLQFLRDYDILQASLIDDATDMLQISPSLVTDMIDAISNVVKVSVQREVSQSAYVSVILGEHSEEPLKSQLSTVLRYLKDGEICERFIGFTNSEGHKSAQQIVGHINKVVTEFQISRRMIAYSLDGSVLYSVAILNEMRRELKSLYPFAYFIPWYFHKLDHVLHQSLCFSQDFDYFFKSLTALSSFFREESRMRADFQSFRTGEIPNLDILNSKSHFEYFNSLKSFRLCVTDFFNYIINNPENVTSDSLLKIIGLQTFLTDLKTVFLIKAFARLFAITLPLNEALTCKIPHKEFSSNSGDCIMPALQKELEYGAFEALWKETLCELGEIHEPEPTVRSGNKPPSCKKFTFHKLYLDLVRCITSQIKCRFDNVKKLEFFNILNLKQPRKDPDDDVSVQSLILSYGKCFNISQLTKEISMMDEHKGSIKTGSVHQLLKFFMTTGLSRSFANLLKLCEIILIMPCTSPSADGYSSKSQEISAWSYSPGKYEIDGDISLLCVERDYLSDLRKKVTFYDEVIQKFQEINKTMELRNA